MRRGLASGRDDAKRLIAAGDVRVGGSSMVKPATLVGADTPIVVEGGTRADWASRGGLKLDAALERFDIDVGGARALDVGASTGGFTDVLLERGAASVTAVDVGYGQLVWRLQQDPRVTVVDRTNFRTLDVTTLDVPFDVVVVDVSFISVGLIAANLASAGRPATRYVVLVKPQFEVGRDRVGRGGIVSDRAAHADALSSVAAALDSAGIAPLDAMRSPIEGAKGNVEFLLTASLGAERTLGSDRIAEVAAP